MLGRALYPARWWCLAEWTWLDTVVIKYNSCIFMVKLSLESKIQHKHQQCDEILSTFMKITRVNKLKNKTKSIQTSTMLWNVVYQTFTSFQFCILRWCSIPRQVPSQFTKWRYLLMELCDIILRTNRVRCALNIEILDLLNEESVSGACSGS